MTNKQVMIGGAGALIVGTILYLLGFNGSEGYGDGPIKISNLVVTGLSAVASFFLLPKGAQYITSLDYDFFDDEEEETDSSMMAAMHHLKELRTIIGHNPEAAAKLEDLAPIIYRECEE